jgi:hypothetical protein
VQLDLSLPRALEASGLALDQELYKQLLMAQRTACALSTVSNESTPALHMLTGRMALSPSVPGKRESARARELTAASFTPPRTCRLRYERQHHGWNLKPSMACAICSLFSTMAFFSKWTPADSILNCRRQTQQHHCATSSSRRAPTLADQKSGSLAFKLQRMSGQTLTPGWAFVKSAWQSPPWRGAKRCNAGSRQAQSRGRQSCCTGHMVAGTDSGPCYISL